jgi:hypothetical protein
MLYYTAQDGVEVEADSLEEAENMWSDMRKELDDRPDWVFDEAEQIPDEG